MTSEITEDLVYQQTEEIIKLRKLLDASPDVICSFDKEGKFLSVSKACIETWGYHPKELLGKCYLDYVIEKDRSVSLLAGDAIISGKTFTSFENHYIKKDGSIVPIIWSARWDKKEEVMYCVAKDASEKKLIERRTKDYEDGLFRAYKISEIGWWEWDIEKDRLYASDELYLIYGISREEYPVISIETFFSHIPAKQLEKMKQNMTSLFEQSSVEYSHWFTKPNGELIYLTHQLQVHKDQTGNIALINGTTRNTTEKRKAQIALKRSRQRLANIVESIQDGFFAVDKNWQVTYWNKKAEQVLGRSKESIIGKVLWDEYREVLNLKFFSEYHRAMREKVAVHFEEHFPTLNKWFEVNAYPSRDGLSVYFQDITERKQKETELKISSERYQFVAMATSDIIWDWDLITNEIFINDSFEKIYGLHVQPQEALEVWSKHLHPDDRQRVLSTQQAALNNPSLPFWKQKYRIVRANGEIGYVSDKAVIIRNDEGKPIRMVGAVRDITDAKRQEESERILQQRFRLLFDESFIPKWIFDQQTLRFIEVNEAAIQHYGYSRQEFLKMTIQDIRPASERTNIASMYKSITDKSSFRFHGVVKHQKKNGELIDVDTTSHVLKVDGKYQIVVVANDVTEKIEAQKQVSRAIINTQEKERSIIGKELHDNVNQLLTTAKLYVQNVNYYPERQQFFLDKGVDLIQKSISEIRGLSKALITPTLSDLGFKDALEELIAYYKELNHFNVNLNYCINGSIEHELKLSIYRILQELFNNTVKYAKAKEVSVDLNLRASYLRLVYKDDGNGLDLKKYNKGLGLNNIKHRVEFFKGRLKIVSSVENGFMALIVFPVSMD